MHILLLIAELIFLFITSRFISKYLFMLFYNLFRKESVAARVVAFIFFPGTLIHELAHFLMAKTLFVRTGNIELMPEIQGDTLKLGSVQIAKTDILRRFLIGVAPLLIGSILLIIIIYSFFNFFPLTSFEWSWQYVLSVLVVLYGIFVITNTMFSSKKDMEGALGLFILLVFSLLVIFVAGRGEWVVRVMENIINNPTIQQYVNKITIFLFFPVIINGVVLLTYNGLRKLRKRN